MAMRLNANTIAWLALMVATALSWAFGHEARGEETIAAAAVAGVIASAAVKVAIIAWQFMELHGAPRWLLWGLLGWLAAITTVLLAICLG
jgi:cytochrome c oxidase subunit IV